MASQEQQEQKVQLSLTLSTSPPHTVSIQTPYPSEPLKLIASVEQSASPFPDRAVTVLTTYSILDTHHDAFFYRLMGSPQVTVPDAKCPAPLLPLRPVGKHITTIRLTGDPDLLNRDKKDHFDFLTIPPLGQGHAEVIWELPPSKLLMRLGNKREPLQEKLSRFLRSGDSYRIVPGLMYVHWWTFGSLEGPDGLRRKKFARWSLPDDMPLVREPGADETDEVAHKLKDYVDLNNVNYLSSRSAYEGEQIPDIRKMRAEGWVFGESDKGLEFVAVNGDEGVVFTIVE